MKKLLTLILTVFMCVGMVLTAGCGSQSTASTGSGSGEAPDLQAVKDRGVLKVGIKVDVPKFGFKDPNTGETSGMEIDLAHRMAKEILGDIPAVKIEGEMLDLARHIIETKTGAFAPADFEDHYEEAVIELVKAKIAGRKPKRLPKRKDTNVTDLMAALRKSAGLGDEGKPAKKTAARRSTSAENQSKRPPGRKAG